VEQLDPFADLLAFVLALPRLSELHPSMITSKAATNDHLKTGHHEVTETGSV
jgi:hypothetical protein